MISILRVLCVSMPSVCFAKDTIIAYDTLVSDMNRAHRFQKVDGKPATKTELKVTLGSIDIAKRISPAS